MEKDTRAVAYYVIEKTKLSRLSLNANEKRKMKLSECHPQESNTATKTEFLIILVEETVKVISFMANTMLCKENAMGDSPFVSENVRHLIRTMVNKMIMVRILKKGN